MAQRSITNAFAVREARLTEDAESDLPRMHRLDAACFFRPFRFTAASLRRYACDEDALTLVAEHGSATMLDDLAGFLIVQLDHSTTSAYVVTLDVHPELRRLGLASELLSEGERRMREAGVGAIYLHVYAGNAGAIALYERLGYVRQELKLDLYGMGLDGLTYRKQLG